MLATGITAHIVLGHGIPEGPTAYVLTSDERGGPMLWNACTGRSYAAHDSTLPLVSVGCVFDASNVWANVQESARPAELVWDLADEKKWRPLIGKHAWEGEHESSPVQHAQLHYRRTPDQLREGLEREIEDVLQREARYA